MHSTNRVTFKLLIITFGDVFGTACLLLMSIQYETVKHDLINIEAWNINQNESVMSSDWVEILRQWLLAKNSCSRKNARYCTRLLKLTFLWPKKWSVVIKEVLWSVLFTEDCSGLRNAHCNMCVWSHQEPVLLSMWLLYDQWYGGGGGWWVWGHQGSLTASLGQEAFLTADARLD